MGLDIWDGLFKGSNDDTDEYDVCGMSCVHWGFLRAYMSVREALDHSLSVLTNDFAPGFVINHARASITKPFSTAEALLCPRPRLLTWNPSSFPHDVVHCRISRATEHDHTISLHEDISIFSQAVRDSEFSIH
jgi:hypothetical protein